MKIVIISGGSLDYDFAADYIEKVRPDCIIAVDRGMKFCYEKNICPDYVLGDFDSIEPEIMADISKQHQVRMIKFQPEKDDTDTEIALKKAIELGGKEVILLGTLGGRMDHCIANIHMLRLALEQKVDACIVDVQNHIRLLNDAFVLKKTEQWGRYVSFLPYTDIVKGLTLKGFKYPLDHYRMEMGLSIGVSNEIVDEEALVTFEDGILMMIQSRD